MKSSVSMKGWAAVLLGFVLAGVCLAGETGKISGRVMDRRSGEALPQASVMIVGTELGAATDRNGYYAVLNMPIGEYSVETSMVGFQTMSVTGVRVQADQTARVDFRLEATAIAMPKVVVTAEKPMVSKEMVAARYTVRAEEMIHLPADRLSELVFFSAGVVKTESTFHVRGGRANEVDYLIDGVSVVDPLTGEFGIELSRGVADEVIFMPGGFSAEYGRAMSGVINLITVNPRQSFGAGYRMKSEEPMPLYYDFGYTDQGLQVHVPVARNFRTVFNVGLTTPDDWDPRLFTLPHKARQDYSLYGKGFYEVGGKLKIGLSGAASRTQFDRYKSAWKLRLDDYRSDLRAGNLGVGKITYMPNSRSYYRLTVSRFHTGKTGGIRKPGPIQFWQDFQFRDTSEYVDPGMDNNNPWGCPYEKYWSFYTYGTYDDFRRTRTRVWTGKLAANNQVTSTHQVSAGATGDLYSVTSERVRWPAWRPVVDTYAFTPNNLSLYVQDKIEYEGLFANLGLRYDRFAPNASYMDSIVRDSLGGLDTVRTPASSKSQVSPRLGVSFRITDWLFARANLGYYFQAPLFGVLYDNTVRPVRHRTVYGDSLRLVVGNPDLKPERTQSYELGLQGEVAKGLLLTANIWRKDVKDLIGSREVPALPQPYVTYINVDFAWLTGIEFIFDVRNDWLSTKFSYTYSRARGTSSYANEGYDRFLSQGDSSVPAKEYTLDFDQPHRAFVQIDMKMPEKVSGTGWLDAALNKTALHLLGYVGNGFPYTPPGGKGDLQTWNTRQGPMRSNVDVVITKGLKLGRLKLDLVAEVLNVLDIRDVLFVYPTGKPDDDGRRVEFSDFQRSGMLAMRYGDPGYNHRRDLNHDGYLTQFEEYYSTYLYHRASIDWVNNYGPPRRARLGIELGW